MRLLIDLKKGTVPGQSVIELLIATAVFAMVAASIIFLVLGAHINGQQGKEISQAEGLAKEGIEAVRSIRDQ